MSGTLLTRIKETFPDAAIQILTDDSTPAEGTMGIRFCEEDACTDVELISRPARASRKAIDTKAHNFIAISKAMPPRVQMVPAGKKVPRNFFPVACWTGDTINFSISSSVSDQAIEEVVTSTLPSLIGQKPEKKDFLQLCMGMSLGIDKEKKELQQREANNRKQGQSYLRRAEEYLEAADRQTKMILNLEEMEKGMLNKHAEEQWNDIMELIPRALQSVKIEDGKIIALTNPITLLGNFMGAYEIHIDVKDANPKIFGVSPGINTDGYPHPHVKERGSGGSVCWGTLTNMIAELRSSKNYAHLITASLRLLNQYNRDSEYTNLSNWGRRWAGTSDETTKSDCQSRGPRHSLAQARKCMICESSCEHKRDNQVHDACLSMSMPQDCSKCSEEDCRHFAGRFDRCWHMMEKQGPAFCMLRCGREECSHIEEATKLCSKNNLREDGTCPAADKCWRPCIKKGDE